MIGSRNQRLLPYITINLVYSLYRVYKERDAQSGSSFLYDSFRIMSVLQDERYDLKPNYILIGANNLPLSNG
jgi:hypothetical protein